MTVLTAVQEPNPPLREKAETVEKKNGGFMHLKKICDDMRETMRFLDGVGIAAPQIGVQKRIFVIEAGLFPDVKIPSDIFINPRITGRSFKRLNGEEGCLSVKGIWGSVKRAQGVTVEASDIHGKKFTLRGKELLARVLQHETDHLDGILYIDRAIPSSLHTYVTETEHGTKK